MKPVGFARVAAMAMALVAGAVALASPAYAQRRPATPAAPAVTAQQRTDGMAQAPAIITAGNIPCTLADARKIGTSGRGAEAQTFYELACTNQLGFVVATRPSQPPQAFTCIETGAQPNPANGINPLHCILPGNANQAQFLAQYVAKAGPRSCTPGQVRPIGQTTSNTIFEVTCSQGGGYIMFTSVPPNPANDVRMTTCLAYAGQTGNVTCTLTDANAMLTATDALFQATPERCPVRERRYVLSTTTGSDYFEYACSNGQNVGFMMEVNAAGAVARTVPCARAAFVPGGCTLVNAVQAQTEANGLYTRLATAAGFNCQVERYAAFPVQGDVVEMVCSNRPDGAVGIFPAGASTAPARIIPCAYAALVGYRCSLKTEAENMPQYLVRVTEDLRAQNRPSCAASAYRVVGTNQERTTGYIEVACADGLLGYILEYQLAPQIRATAATPCAMARTCQLPGNRPAAAGATPPRR